MTAERPDEGFTLVELLTVVVILGVLAGIAIPSFLNQREKGYRATAVSDARSIMTAQTAVLGDSGFTADPGTLEANGYIRSDGVAEPVVKLVGNGYHACVKHQRLTEWLVLDGLTQSTSWAADSSTCV